MSAVGGKADMAFALQMSAFDPKRTSGCEALRPVIHFSSPGRKVLGFRDYARRVLGEAHAAARVHHALGGAAAAWPLAVRAQQPAMPVIGFLRDGSPDASARYAAAFRKGLNETGYVEGQNVTVEYHWLEGQYDRLPAADGGSGPPPGGRDRPVGNLPALAAKAATATIPIVFGVGDDPVRLGLVSQPRPAWWQCDRHQLFPPGGDGQAAAAPA